ncbi:flagellar basal body-associated protein FliL [Aurantivibrio plasticivorans]
MADEDDTEDTGEGEEGSGGGKKKLSILAAIILVLIIISVVGTLFALDMFTGAEDEMVEAEMIEEVPEEDQGPKPAIYFPLKPPIIVNFQARGRQRFLQAELTLMTRDETVISAIETHMPAIRNALVLLFGGQVYEDLQTHEGKEKLQEAAREEIQALLEKEIGDAGIEQVLFTSFVMQ